MPRCPDCRKHFRCLNDEPADECPHCGYTGRCVSCERRHAACICHHREDSYPDDDDNSNQEADNDND